MWKSTLKQKVLFATFKIYDLQGEFLGIASGCIDRIHREWEPRGGVKFTFDIKYYKLVDMTNVVNG